MRRKRHGGRILLDRPVSGECNPFHWSILHSQEIRNMANNFGIPQEVEYRLRQKFKVCVYCRGEMQEHAAAIGCPSDKATIEHLNENPPFSWSDGLKEEDFVICCGSCNASRGQKSLTAWFTSSYCVKRGITASTVAEEVKQYLERQVPGTPQPPAPPS
jgi:hypothetical protein